MAPGQAGPERRNDVDPAFCLTYLLYPEGRKGNVINFLAEGSTILKSCMQSVAVVFNAQEMSLAGRRGIKLGELRIERATFICYNRSAKDSIMYILIHVVSLALAFISPVCSAQKYYGPQDPRVEDALTLEHPSNGVSTTPDGRLFVLYARVDGSKGPQVVEYNQETNTTTPYPNAQWNNYTEGDDPSRHLIRTNSQRIGPDGNLWIVDVGSPGFGEPVILPNGPKLVVVNVTTDEVCRVYPMGNATLYNSLLDDIRFNPGTGFAYLTDAGAPALIILNLDSGDTRRVLIDDPSTDAYMPVSAEGNLLRTAEGAFQRIYADHLEVSPDGKWFYFQPANGGLSRIETKYLDQAFYNSTLAQVLRQYREPYAHTPSTGGTAIDAQGNIYVSDTDSQRIISIYPNGTMTLLVQDPRLLWVDAMWIDSQQRLWMPATQLNRGTPFNNESYIEKPLHVYTIDVGEGPSQIDHA